MPLIPAWATQTPAGTDPTAWQHWWEYNQDAYIDLRGRLSWESTDGDTFFGGAAENTNARRNAHAAAYERLTDALASSLRGVNNLEYVRAAVIALAKISSGAPPHSEHLDPVIGFYLSDGFLDNHSLAAAMLGVQGHPAALPALLDLLADSQKGRDLVKRPEVDYRTRAFAAYGLGVLGHNATDGEVKRTIVSALFDALHDDASRSRDVKVAAVIALGLVPIEPKLGPPKCDCGGLRHDPDSSRVSEIAWLLRDLASRDTPAEVRTFAPTSLARLTEGMPEDVRKRVADALLLAIDDSSREPAAVKQSCVIALGRMGDGDDDEVDRRIRHGLERVAEKGDEASRRFALISMAQVGARTGTSVERSASGQSAMTSALLRNLASSSDRARAWSALALGVLAHDLRANQRAPAREIAAALRSALDKSRTSSEFAACALAAGLCADASAAPSVIARLSATKDDEARGYAALALGLMNAREAIAPLQAILGQAEQRPELHRRAAMGLGLLGDYKLVPQLSQRLTEMQSASARSSIAWALGCIAAPQAVDALVKLLGDADAQYQPRTSAAESLGLVADRSSTRWSELLSPNLNYLAGTPTLTNTNRTGVLDLR